MEAGDFSQVSSWQKTTDKLPIKTCRIMTFTGSEFRVNYQIDTSTWILNLHSVTENPDSNRWNNGKLGQIFQLNQWSKSSV